ncbi:hypothetical protein [Afipia sp. GAS231]|uniref:hypothetical protein n=1 Tax=Afipia sp. GAS231 TaxID=1882747 RepID=UPI0012F9E467|nr:hypothetical protein [Afipia sp. GAS231]
MAAAVARTPVRPRNLFKATWADDPYIVATAISFQSGRGMIAIEPCAKLKGHVLEFQFVLELPLGFGLRMDRHIRILRLQKR